MMLKSTKVQIELLTDINKILFVEQNIRGGMSYINMRYSTTKPNEEEEIPGEVPSEIIYIDGNFITLIKVNYYEH